MRNRHRPSDVPFAEACALLSSVLTGTVRQSIAGDASNAADLGKALARLRDGMRSNVLKSGAGSIDIETIVGPYDRLTRVDGFHALNDWDGISDRSNEDTIPIDVLNYLIRERGSQPPDRTALAIVLDYYFLYVLALLSLRIWDEGDADENLERLKVVLHDLQGASGSGQQFVSNAETLILVATSHYELVERGFGALLDKVRTLNVPHRTNIALVHAVCLGCHLRFGFEATYGRDVVTMRNDNVADYPWLCFSVTTLMEEYARTRDSGADAASRGTLVEGILNGLSPDPGAFVGSLPAMVSGCQPERARFCEMYQNHKPDLLERFEQLRPSDQAYSPLSLFFNFSQNILKGMVVDALLWGEPSSLALNDLLTAHASDPAASTRTATALMGYARANPDRIGGRRMPAIVYDPVSGRRAFAGAMRGLR